MISGQLTDKADTPAPGDFFLTFDAEDGFTASFSAQVAIDVLADGTVDVRGIAQTWNGVPGKWIVEGTGNAKFVLPAQ